MARKARQTSGTGIYHVMLRGINRQVIFESNADYSYFIRILYRMVYPMDESRHPQPSLCSIYAYCLMPNHVHLLLREKAETLSSVVKRIAAAYAWYYKNTRGQDPCAYINIAICKITNNGQRIKNLLSNHILSTQNTYN